MRFVTYNPYATVFRNQLIMNEMRTNIKMSPVTRIQLHCALIVPTRPCAQKTILRYTRDYYLGSQHPLPFVTPGHVTV